MNDKDLDDLYTIWELQDELYTDDDIPDIENGLITKSENVLKELNEEELEINRKEELKC